MESNRNNYKTWCCICGTVTSISISAVLLVSIILMIVGSTEYSSYTSYPLLSGSISSSSRRQISIDANDCPGGNPKITLKNNYFSDFTLFMFLGSSGSTTTYCTANPGYSCSFYVSGVEQQTLTVKDDGTVGGSASFDVSCYAEQKDNLQSGTFIWGLVLFCLAVGFCIICSVGPCVCWCYYNTLMKDYTNSEISPSAGGYQRVPETKTPTRDGPINTRVDRRSGNIVVDNVRTGLVDGVAVRVEEKMEGHLTNSGKFVGQLTKTIAATDGESVFVTGRVRQVQEK